MPHCQIHNILLLRLLPQLLRNAAPANHFAAAFSVAITILLLLLLVLRSS